MDCPSYLVSDIDCGCRSLGKFQKAPWVFTSYHLFVWMFIQIFYLSCGSFSATTNTSRLCFYLVSPLSTSSFIVTFDSLDGCWQFRTRLPLLQSVQYLSLSPTHTSDINHVSSFPANIHISLLPLALFLTASSHIRWISLLPLIIITSFFHTPSLILPHIVS